MNKLFSSIFPLFALFTSLSIQLHSLKATSLGTTNYRPSELLKKDVYFLYGAEHLKLENNFFDIPVIYNAEVQKWISFFLNKGKNYFIRYAERAGRYADVMGEILVRHGLPRDFIFLAMAESGFSNHAKSKASAVGPWQFISSTGKKFHLKINWYVDERRDPIKSTMAAASYLKRLYEIFGSWELAAAGYNAGEGKIGRAIRKYGTHSFWKLSEYKMIKNETKNYVPKIMALAIIGKNLKSFNMGEIDFHAPLDFEEIEVAPLTDLYLVAKELKIDVKELFKLNPELLRWMTPPGQKYSLRVNVGLKVAWNTCCEKTPQKVVAQDYQFYTTPQRISLKDVGNIYHLPLTILTDLNPSLPRHSSLKKGEHVVLPFRQGQSLKSSMYSDLFEKKSAPRKNRRRYQERLVLAKNRGEKINNPKEFYTVKRGDTLWDVAKKNGVSLDTLIKTNYDILGGRMIRAGDILAIR